jgi:hypothetical protein
MWLLVRAMQRWREYMLRVAVPGRSHRLLATSSAMLSRGVVAGESGKLVAQHTTEDSATNLRPTGHMHTRVLGGPASRLADDDELSCSIESSAASVPECNKATFQTGFILAGEHRVQESRGVRGSLIHAALTGGRELVA